MIVRIVKEPLRERTQWLWRIQAAGFVALGVGILAVWNPLTQPGPTVCLLRRAVGLPCPMCGMTRGVALCLRGHPLEATWFNPLALPILLVAVVLALKWGLECVSGKRFHVIAPPWMSRNLIHAGYVVLALNWAYMLTFRREDPFVTTWLGQLWTILAVQGPIR